MNIHEMHNTFRTLGQQMGMQLVRGILPQSIDVYLNNAIIDKIQEELLSGVETAMKTGFTTQVSSMSLINSFRTLYKEDYFPLGLSSSMGIAYNFFSPIGKYVIDIPFSYGINPMLFLGFTLSFKAMNSKTVSCRLIPADELNITMSDYCNAASKEHPIAVVLGNQIHIYTNVLEDIVSGISMQYVNYPNVVKYSEIKEECVNCDLPEYTHYDVVERAVTKYLSSIAGSSAQRKQ